MNEANVEIEDIQLRVVEFDRGIAELTISLDISAEPMQVFEVSHGLVAKIQKMLLEEYGIRNL